MVCNTPSSQDASTHQIWNSYLKEYRRYEPDTKRDGRTDGRTVRLLYASQSSFGGIKITQRVKNVLYSELIITPFLLLSFSDYSTNIYQNIINIRKINKWPRHINNHKLFACGITCSTFVVICWLFSRLIVFKKPFRKIYQSFKLFGSRSGPTFCRSWSGSKLFAKLSTDDKSSC